MSEPTTPTRAIGFVTTFTVTIEQDDGDPDRISAQDVLDALDRYFDTVQCVQVEEAK